MNQTTGWAIFNGLGEPIPASVQRTRAETLMWLTGPNKTKSQRRRYWSHWQKRWGYSIRKVVIQEQTSE